MVKQAFKIFITDRIVKVQCGKHKDCLIFKTKRLIRYQYREGLKKKYMYLVIE